MGATHVIAADLVSLGSVCAVADWWDAAACSGAGYDNFFGEGSRTHTWKAVCASCPVAEVCLWSAMAAELGVPVGHRYGIFGGTTPSQRARMDRLMDGAAVGARLTQAMAVWTARLAGRAAAAGSVAEELAEDMAEADPEELVADNLEADLAGEDLIEDLTEAGPTGAELTVAGLTEESSVAVPVPSAYRGRSMSWNGGPAKNPEPGMRRCKRCDDVKPIDEFYVNDPKRGYRRGSCIPCVKLEREERRERGREQGVAA